MENNKRAAVELFARLSQSDVAGALDLLTDDVTWRIPGKPELTPVQGIFDKERLTKLIQRLLGGLEAGLQMSVLSAIAEGDHVAVEVESSGDLKNGRKYRQSYHFAIDFRGGKISAVREYLDTHHAWDVWIRP